MPVRRHIFREPHYLHLYLSGQVTAEEYFQCFADLTASDAFYPAIPTLMEIGHAAEVAIDDLQMAEAEEMSEVVIEARAGVHYRIAIAGGPLDTRSFVTMAQQIVSSQSDAQVFDSVLDAYRWLFA